MKARGQTIFETEIGTVNSVAQHLPIDVRTK